MPSTTFLPRLGLSALLLSCASWAAADVPSVLTDIAPVQGLSARVMEGVGEPSLLLPPGTSPHDYALKPSDARALSKADLVVWIGPALAPWLEKSLNQLAPDAARLGLLEAPGGRVIERPVMGGPEAHEEHDEHDEHGHDDHAHEDHDEHGHDDHDDHAHDHGPIDPHAWLGPDNAALWLGLIAEELAALDPENAAVYRANAAAGQAEIEAAVAEAKALLEPVHELPFVTQHAAYGYFTSYFGLRSLGSLAGTDAVPPGPAGLAQLRDAAQEAGAVCIFIEPQMSSALASSIAKDIGAAVGSLDPLGSDIEPGPGFYPALISTISGSIVRCLGDT